MVRSNYTPQQLISSKPDIDNETACAAWFADCMRWADIERVEDIKNIAWRANEEVQDYCKRHQAIEVLVGKLQAYIKIVCIETPTPPDLKPEVPDIEAATSSLTITWPTVGSNAASPTLPPQQS